MSGRIKQIIDLTLTYYEELLNRWLHRKECERCVALYDELQRVIAEKNYLLQIALKRDDVIPPSEPEDIDYQLMKPRFVPWSQRRKQHETKVKRSREPEVVTKPELTDGETIFEQELNNAGKVS